MTRTLTAVLGLSLLAQPALAQDRAFPATLAGQAVVPAMTVTPAPADAAPFLATSGKFTSVPRARNEAPGTVPGKDGVRPTGLSLPFDGQPVQGFSGIRHMPDGSFWSLSDNGFGGKGNSSDAMLMLHHLAIDWAAGAVTRQDTVFLSDPDRKAPFPIVMEGAATRYLTGADFDVESIQPVEDGFWVGEEFGPFLLKFTRDGRLSDVIATRIGDRAVASPDSPAMALPANPTQPLPPFNLKRSGGYEGLALSPDGARAYGLLEGPVYVDGKPEQVDGQTALRIIELDTAAKAWTGRSWLYPLAAGAEAIGDFNMIDATHALVIERDNGAGRVAQECPDAKAPRPDCFASAARVKRISKIEMTEANAGAAVRKIGHIDLLAILDPKGLAKQGGHDGTYDMPFVTIENVDRVDAAHIVVANDNNLPFSAGRALDRADDTEFVLLEVGEFLSAE